MAREHILIFVQVAILLFIVGAMVRSLARTTARPAAFAIGFILVVYLILVATGLTILSWALEQIFAISAILLVVIFREEARDLLVGLGRKVEGILPSGPKGDKEASGTVADEVTRALETLSTSGVGALIVIERKDSLSDLLGTGFPLNATTHSYLIEAIFRTNSPLHDGAIVINQDRIQAAGVVLPLYEGFHPSLRRKGTRHRAALGLSVKSDALVVVLSEENAKLHVAHDGNLRHIPPSEIRREIVTQITLPARQKGIIDQLKAQIRSWISSWQEPRHSD